MEATVSQKTTLDQAQSKARRQQKSAPSVLTIPGRLARQAMMAGIMASASQTDISPAERLHAAQAEAATQTRLPEFPPAVQRFVSTGNISAEAFAAAQTRLAALNEQARTATTMVALQSASLQMRALTNELTEQGLSAEQLKMINEGRRWFWRGVVDSLPLMDDFLVGADFGIGTTIASGVDGYMWVSGMGNIETHIESKTKFLLPPPRQMTPPENTGFVTHVMHWWDLLASTLLWCVQNGLVITLGTIAFIILGVGSYCAADAVFFLTEPVCIDLVNSVINMIKAAAIFN